MEFIIADQDRMELGIHGKYAITGCSEFGRARKSEHYDDLLCGRSTEGQSGAQDVSGCINL